MEEKDRDLDDLTAALKEKDIHIKELEIELLTANQRQLADDGEHAQEMREMAEKLDQCKVSVVFTESVDVLLKKSLKLVCVWEIRLNKWLKYSAVSLGRHTGIEM